MSPTLFIIVAEVLTRNLNNLHREEDFFGYRLLKWSLETNYLSYTDDTILFFLGDRVSIIKMMNVLEIYEKVSRQLVNKSKSLFYLHENTPLILTIRLKSYLESGKVNFL